MNATDAKGKIPLFYAKEEGRVAVAQLLCNAAAKEGAKVWVDAFPRNLPPP